MQTSLLRASGVVLGVAGAFMLAACSDDAGSGSPAVSAEPPRTQQAGQSLPPGSWQLSCDNGSVSNDVLTASCRTLSGSVLQTSLSGVSDCLGQIIQGGDIGNIDGSLICTTPPRF